MNARASVMAVSANLGLRPRFPEKLRRKAVASLLIFLRRTSSMGMETQPGKKIGVAAPVRVPGAIAAISAESRIIKPAEAPRAPEGLT